MSTSLLRGLSALEMLADEALGVSDIARRLGVDKAGVSRMLGRLHAEGWVLRTGARYVLGERAVALSGGDPASIRRRAGRVVRRLHGDTGATAMVIRMVGDGARPVAVAGETRVLDPEEPFEHLWGTAGGIALLAQLPEVELARRLAVDPWPRPASSSAPADADAVRAAVRAVRAGVPAQEREWSVPGAACLAVPWPILEPAAPHAVLLIGAVDLVDRGLAAARAALEGAVQAATGSD